MKSKVEPSTVLNPKQDFSSVRVANEKFDGTVEYEDGEEQLRSLFQFDEEEFVENEVEPLLQSNIRDDLDIEQDEKKKGKSLFSKVKLFGIFFIGLVFAEAFLFIRELIVNFNLLSAAWLAFFSTVLIVVFSNTVREFKSLKKLKDVELFKRQSQYFFNSPASGSAEKFCDKLSSPIQFDYENAISDWKKAIQKHHTNKEVINLFETMVVVQADRRALSVIRKQATATAALIGVSPLAAIDMLIVLYRNWQMIHQVGQCYGLSLSYWAKVRLLKQIVRNMIYAGASEILLDAGVYALGSSITSKLSTKVAQGVGAGALTGRLGLQVITQSRPIDWTMTKKPTLTSITKHILRDLRDV